MRLEAEDAEQQRLRSGVGVGVTVANQTISGVIGGMPLMCAFRSAFGTALRCTPEWREKAAQGVDRGNLPTTPKRTTELAQHRLRDQRRAERIERLGLDTVCEHLEPDRWRHHERRLQRMQPGDTGIAAEIEAGFGVEPGQRRLDFDRRRRTARDGEAQQRGSYSAVAPLRLMIGVIIVSSRCMNFFRSSVEPPTGSMN